jgi:YegS/Rv2252/BmrU family lipid kinase
MAWQLSALYGPRAIARPGAKDQGSGAATAFGDGIALVINTRSRRGRRSYDAALVQLRHAGVKIDAAIPVTKPKDLPAIVRQLVDSGCKKIVIGGGDGSIAAISGELAYRDVVLGILPLGTANSFARTLNIPLTLDGAVDTLLRGRVVEVDLGKINDQYFANSVAIGLPSQVAQSRPDTWKKYLGILGYLVVGAAKFWSYHPFRCTLTDEQGARTAEVLDILIANGRYHGGAPLAEDTSAVNRQLLVRVVYGENKWRVLQWWLHLALRRPGFPPFVETLFVKQAGIRMRRKRHVSIDGEVSKSAAVDLAIAPGALKVLVPMQYGAAGNGPI